MSEEEKKVIDILINEIADIVISEYCTHCKICENDNTECYYIKAIDKVYNLIEQQQKEIEEKTTIIMAGAEKVKQLDKQIHNFNIEKIEQQEEIEIWEETENDYEHEIARYKKEIEELNELLKEKTMRIAFENIDNFISKDKIRKIIETHYPDVAITKLFELLEE